MCRHFQDSVAAHCSSVHVPSPDAATLCKQRICTVLKRLRSMSHRIDLQGIGHSRQLRQQQTCSTSRSRLLKVLHAIAECMPQILRFPHNSRLHRHCRSYPVQYVIASDCTLCSGLACSSQRQQQHIHARCNTESRVQEARCYRKAASPGRR